MPKLIGWLIFLVVIGAPAAYGVHLWRNYGAIQKLSEERRSITVTPTVDKESVSEIGYIFGMRRENYVRDGYRNLVWFIAVPATGERFSCQYDRGSDDFKVGDGVTFIHNTVRENEAETGYIVGLHDKRKGKVAMVGTNDLDIMELESDDER